MERVEKSAWRCTGLVKAGQNSKNVVDELNINSVKYIIIPMLDYYNEIIFTIVLQYLSYNISITKGLNPDKPRNLAKVVTVE